MELLDRMFEVELSFLSSEAKNPSILASAFHRQVVVHEPSSLPYAGDWRGLNGIGALLRKMSETWSDMRVEDIDAMRNGDTVFLTCTLHLTCRVSGTSITQPFAEVLRFENDLLIDGTPFYYDTSQILLALGSPTPDSDRSG